MKIRICILSLIAAMCLMLTACGAEGAGGAGEKRTEARSTTETAAYTETEAEYGIENSVSLSYTGMTSEGLADSFVPDDFSFSESYVTDSGDEIYVYTDEDGNEYRFKNNTVFTGISGDHQMITDLNFAISKGTLEKISEESAVISAEEYARELFGGRIDRFEFESVNEYDLGYYTVSFSLKYGEGGYIIGPTCYCEVLLDGKIYSCSLPDLDEYADFDESSVANISKEEVHSYAQAQIKDKYGEGVVSSEITKVLLVKTDGEYRLLVLIDANLGDYCVGETVYYEID